jgi:hypothetical protein
MFQLFPGKDHEKHQVYFENYCSCSKGIDEKYENYHLIYLSTKFSPSQNPSN